ncbi:hypothetical protein JL720_11434 [Aureococcus anophagefferens]|nr:hypothetical protein JL720_11434 [Aureococcus anophagefferens]
MLRVTSKLRIQGTGFEGDGSNLHFEFVPALPKDSYSVVSSSDTSCSIVLKKGKAWPMAGGMSEVTMYLTSIKSDTHGDPDFNLLEEPKAVATIVATPSIVKNEQRTIYMTGSLKFLVNGSNFRAKSTAFTFDPPLYRDVDYVMTVKSPETAQLTLKTGRKWRSDGAPGPLKLTRLDTGGGALRIDSKFGGVTVAEVQADLGAHGVTVETTSDKKYYQSAPELTILGHGFNESSSLNVLRWGNKLMGKGVNYTIVAGTKNTLTLSLAWGSKWRPNAANLPGPLTLLAVNAGAGLVPVGATEAKKGRAVATIYPDPAVHPSPLTTIYRTLTHELWVTGSGFVRGSTSLDLVSTAPRDGELALKPFVDYVLVVFNQTHLRVSLRDGKAWANGPDGELKCVGLDTGPGKIPSVTKEMPRVLATIAADAMHKSGAAVTRTAMTQTIYETPALKKLTITGEHLCADGYRGTDAKVTFSPPVADDVFTVNQAAEKKVVLDLRKSKRWPVGTLYLASLKCGDKTLRTFADGAGVGVATVLPDPTVEAHPELVLYGAHSRRVLEPDAAWVAPEVLAKDAAKGVDLKVSKVDTGAGEVRFDSVTVATVVREPEGDVCDDSCEWALDGVCDDGTAPAYEDDWGTFESGRRWDDDRGGYLYDDVYYGGFYDDYYGAYFDDFADLPACPYGTDCTDCQPLHGDSHYTEVKGGVRQHVRVQPRRLLRRHADERLLQARHGLPGLRPASAATTRPTTAAWWDGDASNWYWDDDYYDDDRRRFDDFYYDTATFSGNKDGVFDDDGRLRPVGAQPRPDGDLGKPADGGAASLLVAALLELTSNPSAKKTNIPITPDVAYTGDHQA